MKHFAFALRNWRGLSLLTLSLLLTGCGGAACPSATAAKPALQWEAELRDKALLETRPGHRITIKRDVHDFYIDADADDVARAFHDVMRDPNRHFGLIQVHRPAAETNLAFHQGSRFQGEYEIEGAGVFWSDLDKTRIGHEALCSFESENTSDYGEISGLELPPARAPAGRTRPLPQTTYFMEYRYLVGSPIGGSSRFEVKQVADGLSVVTQIFTYQETTSSFAAIFANGVLTLHDQVVWSQVAQTADKLNAEIVWTDVAPEYRISIAPR